MSEWTETELGEISEVQTGPFGSQLKNEQYITGGTPVITVEHIQDFKIKNFNYPSVTEEDKIRLSKYLLKAGDIIFTRVGSVDLSAYVKPNQDGWMFSSRMLRVRPDKTEVDSRFLSYYFQQPKFREYILNISVGATMPSINTGILKGIPISYPLLSEQRAIGKVLTSLDDKIDLLHCQNTTLETMAETLFRQMMSEHDLDGLQDDQDKIGLEKSRQSINPENHVQDKGEAKEDWKTKQLKEVTDIGIGRTPPRKEFQWFSTDPNDVKWISIKDMGSDGVFISNTSEYLTRKAIKTFNIPVIPEHTVVLSFKMTVGRVAITSDEMLSNEAIAHFKFKKSTPFTKEYLFLFLKTFKYDLLGSTSSIVTSINSAMIKDMEITIPDASTMNEFKERTEPLFNKINQNQTQIRTLTTLRDTLLPKLMSGEIRVKNV